MSSFSDLVHGLERDVAGAVDKLLPAGLPSDTREVAAIAEEAGKVAVTLDPELEPIFQAIGSVGNTIEGALHELGVHIGNLKTKLAARAAAPVAGVPPVPAGAPPVGVPDPSAPQPAAEVPPAAAPEASDPNPLSAPADAGASTEATPSPISAVPDAPPAPPTPPEAPAAETDAALTQAEADFAGLSAEDKAAFETAEGLEETPPPA